NGWAGNIRKYKTKIPEGSAPTRPSGYPDARMLSTPLPSVYPDIRIDPVSVFLPSVYPDIRIVRISGNVR
ncbi:MAG: hypothetical protein ACK5S6_00630, partial [bacterium]